MIYADTDFFLALFKDSDWLKEHAIRFQDQHSQEIITSAATVIELLLIGHKYRLDPRIVATGVFEIAREVQGIDAYTAATAAHYIASDGASPLDAFHAAYCGDNQIVSSDKVFDTLGLRRIKLEKR